MAPESAIAQTASESAGTSWSSPFSGLPSIGRPVVPSTSLVPATSSSPTSAAASIASGTKSFSAATNSLSSTGVGEASCGPVAVTDCALGGVVPVGAKKDSSSMSSGNQSDEGRDSAESLTAQGMPNALPIYPHSCHGALILLLKISHLLPERVVPPVVCGNVFRVGRKKCRGFTCDAACHQPK